MYCDVGENIILYLVEYAYETHLPKEYVQPERLNNNNNIKYTEHEIFKKNVDARHQRCCGIHI